MSDLRFLALPTPLARAYRNGEPDAYGRRPERETSDGSGLPCRHCLDDIEAGEEYLVLAYRPFATEQPYAETGPIFLHARDCESYPGTSAVPDAFLRRPRMMVRGYDAGESIVYGTGAIVPTEALLESAASILSDPRVDVVHVRSATNGCFQCRIDGGSRQATKR